MKCKLTEGNPDVYDVKTNLNVLLKNHVTVTYDKPRNLYIYKRSSVTTTNNKQKQTVFKHHQHGRFLRVSKKQTQYVNRITIIN
jgi:hypothetical protein